MACGTQIVNTTDLRFYLSGNAVAHATSGQITINQETRDVTTKDTNGWREIVGGLKSASGSGEALYEDGASTGFDDFADHIENGTSLVVRFTTDASGEFEFSGPVVVTSLELISSGVEENVSFSYAFDFCGQPSIDTAS